jgi:hypothetical protein
MRKRARPKLEMRKKMRKAINLFRRAKKRRNARSVFLKSVRLKQRHQLIEQWLYRRLEMSPSKQIERGKNVEMTIADQPQSHKGGQRT